MKVDFLLLIVFSITIISCNENLNEERDLCFIDVSTINQQIVSEHTPVSTTEMIEAMAWIWTLSYINENNKCEHTYYKLPYDQDTSIISRRFFDKTHAQTGLGLIIDTTKSYGFSFKHSSSYQSTVAFYLTNRQPYDVVLSTRAGLPILIQEAIDTNGVWRPIEYSSVGGCGNAYYSIKLPSNSYLTGGVVKYTGDFETLIRLKLKNDEQILYSTPFKGKINLEQFEIIERHKKMMEEDRYGYSTFEYLFLHPRRVCKEYW